MMRMLIGWTDTSKGLIVLVVLQLALGLVYLKTSPRVFNDDAWEMSVGKSLADEGTLRHGFIEGWGGMHIHFVQNQIVQPVVLAAVYHLIGFSLWSSRLASVLMGTLAIVATHRVLSRWFSTRTAFAVALLVIIHPWFFEISRRVRPDIFYMAMSMCSVWMACLAFERRSAAFAALCGLFVGLSALCHPTGLVLASVMLGVMVAVQRPSVSTKQVLAVAGGFIVPVGAYVIYVLWAVQDPNVSFFEQMRGGKSVIQHTLSAILSAELGRWLHFVQGTKGLPLAMILIAGVVASFVRSARNDRIIGWTVVIYATALSVTTVNTTSRYLVPMLVFLTAGLVRVAQRLIAADPATCGRLGRGIRRGLAWGAVGGYVVFCVAGTSLLMWKTRHADFDRVVNRVAAVTGPDARVLGPMLFWLGNGKYNYGPFPLDHTWRQTVEMIRPYRFEYVIRTASSFAESGGIRRPPSTMPAFRDNDELAFDDLCRRFGQRVATFTDPDFGAVEVYRIKQEDSDH